MYVKEQLQFCSNKLYNGPLNLYYFSKYITNNKNISQCHEISWSFRFRPHNMHAYPTQNSSIAIIVYITELEAIKCRVQLRFVDNFVLFLSTAEKSIFFVTPYKYRAKYLVSNISVFYMKQNDCNVNQVFSEYALNTTNRVYIKQKIRGHIPGLSHNSLTYSQKFVEGPKI